jgi:hypothetical protein
MNSKLSAVDKIVCALSNTSNPRKLRLFADALHNTSITHLQLRRMGKILGVQVYKHPRKDGRE